MLLRSYRMPLAVIASLVLHVVLVAFIFFSNKYIKMDYTGEVYETMDFIEHQEKRDAVTPEQRKLDVARNTGSSFEIITLSQVDFKKFSAKVNTIEIENINERIKNKPKVAPIVRSPLVKPVLVAKTKVPYPPAAGGVTGNVIVCILVGVDGRPEYVSTAGSSGNPILDGAVVAHCINWRFTPAQDDIGKKVRCLVYIPVDVVP